MNILLICDEYPPGPHGGIGTVVQLLARNYVMQGHKVVVAGFYHSGYGGSDSFDDRGVKVYRCRQDLSSVFFRNRDSLLARGLSRLLILSGIFEKIIIKSLKKYKTFLDSLIAKYDIDVVEMPDYHDYMRFCKHPVYFPKFEVPVIVTLHGSITYFAMEAGMQPARHIFEMEKAIVHAADAVVSVSNYTAMKSARYFHYDKNITVLYNGILMPDEPGNIYKHKNRVIFTGTLVKKKGIYQLVKAWNIVNKQLPDAQLYIYGKGPANNIASLLNEVAGPSVHWMGHTPRNELLKQISQATVAVFPSYAETFGMAPVEAMAHGTAVIFSTLTAGPEVVEHNKTGLLVDPGNVEAIADAIVLLLKDEAINRSFAMAGRKSVSERFDINIIAQQHIALYQEVLNSKQQTNNS